MTDTITHPDATRLADRLRILANTERLQILAIITAAGGDAYQSQVWQRLGRLTQSSVAHHIRLLSDAGFVVRRRDGFRVYLTVDVDRVVATANGLPGGRR